MSHTVRHSLVLGGIRSGKSDLAERLAADSGRAVVYVATARAGDAEMAERIRRHRERRPAEWGLIEVETDLAGTLRSQADSAPCLLIDCMSLWLSGLLESDRADTEIEAFLEALHAYPGPLVVVSNEVGLGLVAMDPLSREFCDRLGWLNQALATRCDDVLLSVAGCPLVLRGHLPGDGS